MLLISNLLLESTLLFYNISKVFGEGAAWRILIIFCLLVGFPFALLSFAWVVWLFCFVYAHLSVNGRFPGIELHVGFWDAPKPRGFPIGFVKLQGF